LGVVPRVRRPMIAACVKARFSRVDSNLRGTSLEAGRNDPRIIVDAIRTMMSRQLTEKGQQTDGKVETKGRERKVKLG
jgi:hypothetical protein